jgi:hypothetical protein
MSPYSIKDYEEDGMFAYMDNKRTINETVGSKRKAGKGSAACTVTAPATKGKATCVKANQKEINDEGSKSSEFDLDDSNSYLALLYLYMDYCRHFSVCHRDY